MLINNATGVFSKIIILFLILFSKPFVDYTTSGLEYPLLFIFNILFFIFYSKDNFSKKNLLLITFIASLASVTRQDNILFFIFPILYYIYKIGFKNSIIPLFFGIVAFYNMGNFFFNILWFFIPKHILFKS